MGVVQACTNDYIILLKLLRYVYSYIIMHMIGDQIEISSLRQQRLISPSQLLSALTMFNEDIK